MVEITDKCFFCREGIFLSEEKEIITQNDYSILSIFGIERTEVHKTCKEIVLLFPIEINTEKLLEEVNIINGQVLFYLLVCVIPDENNNQLGTLKIESNQEELADLEGMDTPNENAKLNWYLIRSMKKIYLAFRDLLNNPNLDFNEVKQILDQNKIKIE